MSMQRNHPYLILLIALFCCQAVMADESSEPVDADILLVGGTLYLGDGEPGVEGNVAIDGKKSSRLESSKPSRSNRRSIVAA